ncbi:MAG: DUF4249 domain-containing protein [Tannerellaceae bacterium]|nr:DUF4249 domain-containing protein [Tannerellaceae bacterium]
MSLDGEEYVSTFQSPLFTPEIELSITKEKTGDPVLVSVSTHDPLAQSPYYRWEYKENWEVHAELYANVTAVMFGAQVIEYIWHDLETSNNKYYCWGADSSRIFILDSTDKLIENRIRLKKLIEIEPADDRLSQLYFISVKQTMLSKEAFDYFSNLQENIDKSGGLFSKMPSEMRGNIICISDPEKTVIGYVDVSVPTYTEKYIERNDGFYERPYNNCLSQITDDFESTMPVFYKTEGEELKAPEDCIDCRRKRNASKNKPAFWPTNVL